MRGALDGARERALLQFWQRRAGFGGDAARRRLAEVVCLLRRDGEVLGASSVFPAELAPIGGWRFFVMRSLLDEGMEDLHGTLITSTFDALDAERPGPAGAPVGLCALLDPDERRRRPEAEWSNPRMIYAGYLRDGRQVRIAYFSDEVSRASIPRGAAGSSPGYQIVRFDRQERIRREDVIAAWTTHSGLSRPEAERRVDELLLIAVDRRGSLAGISTAFLARHEQLQADMWHLRAFTPLAHRNSQVAFSLLVAATDRLIERFASGEDGRGLGIVIEIENEGVRRRFPKGLWYETDYLFIGRSDRGADVRVHYFPGVRAPEPTLRAGPIPSQ